MKKEGKDYEITSDGRTVWINGPLSLLGRFSRFGVDVHAEMKADGTGGECVGCKTGTPDWALFKKKMREVHDIEVGDVHKPAWAKEEMRDE